MDEREVIKTPKPTAFNEPAELKRRKEFSNREVGITHPDKKGFIRISDGGEIEIFAAPGVGLVINPNTRSISLFADSIKFFCKEDDGLRWNEKSFNPAADVYNEPALVKTGDFSNNPAYYRSSYYVDNLSLFDENQAQTAITIMGEYGLGLNTGRSQPPVFDPNGLTFEQFRLAQSYSRNHSETEVQSLIDFMKSGYPFEEAVEKVENEEPAAEQDKQLDYINNDLDKK